MLFWIYLFGIDLVAAIVVKLNFNFGPLVKISRLDPCSFKMNNVSCHLLFEELVN